MTTQQVLLLNCLYLIILATIATLTRATLRRIGGALAGAATAGIVALTIIDLGEHAGWWHFVIPRGPFFLALEEIGFTTGAFVFLITWRIARRFGGRGLVVTLFIFAAIGPPRDYWYMRSFPEWGVYAPGILPMLAISGAYVLFGIVGHGLMRLIAGPAAADRLAGRPWESR